MSRGISTIELLIALAIGASVIVATTSLTLGMPGALQNARMERDAYAYASTLLDSAEQASFQLLSPVDPISTSTWRGYEGSLTIEYLYDELAARITANVGWKDSNGKDAHISIPSLITDTELAHDLSCNPFLDDDWRTPRVRASYALTPGDLLPAEFPPDPYPVTSLAVLGNSLVLASDMTATATQPTLFFFFLSGADKPAFLGASDNTSVSRTGITSIAVGGGYAYAANGFGSASQQTCASEGTCAQLQIYDLQDADAERAATLSLATLSAPFARTVSGNTAAAQSVAYRRGLLFLGLEKTSGGFEFNIIDVSDPLTPRWIGGIPVGRSIEHIALTRTHAYVATSDSSNELVIVDIRNPEDPRRVGSWNAPGAANFGIGNYVSVRGPHTFFGRTYVNNAAEFALLSTQDPAHITALSQKDIGTHANPEGVEGLVIRESIAAVMSGTKVHFWDISDPYDITPYATSLDLGSKGTGLVCSGSMLIASTDAGGTGRIHIISGS